MTYNQMMKKAALNAEFAFTGIYVGNYSEYRKGSGLYGSDALREEKKRPEFKGYKTKIVREEGGVSLYIENKYFKDRAKKDLEKKINGYEARKASLYEKYLESLKALEAEQEEYVSRLNEMKEGDANNEAIARGN